MSAVFDEDKQHIDPVTNTLLVGGKIYIGEPGLDPIVNPKNVYDNRALTGSPLGQPVIIDVNGRATNKMWVSGKYSLKIDSSADVQKDYELQNGIDEQIGNTLTTNSLGVNDVTVTGSPTVTALIDNQTYIFTAPADNTGAMTLKIDNTAVTSIRKGHDQLLSSGDVKASQKMMVVYNAADNWFELQSGLQVYPTLVANHIRGGSTQITNGTVTHNDLTISSLIAKNTFESFGPTGSGADNIWTELDIVPVGAGILIATATILVQPDSTSRAQGELYTQDGSSSAAVSGSINQIASYGVDVDSAITGQSFMRVSVMIPMNSSRVTKLAWNDSGSSSTTISISYRGFITD